jgi:hypothetical protein
LLGKESTQTFRQPVQMPRRWPGDEADMTAVCGLLEENVVGHFMLVRK